MPARLHQKNDNRGWESQLRAQVAPNEFETAETREHRYNELDSC